MTMFMFPSGRQSVLVSFSSLFWFYVPDVYCFGSFPWLSLFSAAAGSCFGEKALKSDSALPAQTSNLRRGDQTRT